MITKRELKKGLFLIILNFIIFQASFCQENYQPGYIVSLKGDTLRGYIDYRNWDKNPKMISFKERIDGNKIQYCAVDIKQFNVSDEVYESAIVLTEISPTTTNNLTFSKELMYEVDTTFLEAVIKGDKSLYFYKNNFGKELFYIKQDSSFELLVYKKYKVDQNEKTIIAENNRYFSQLAYYLRDCSMIQDKFKGLTYTKENLKKFFLYYYDCTHTPFTSNPNVASKDKKNVKNQDSDVFVKKKEKITVEGGFVAGITSTSLKFSAGSSDYYYLTKANFPKSNNFSAGLYLNIVFPRNQKKWSLYNEVTYFSYNTTGCYKSYENAYKYSYSYSTFKYSYLKMTNMIRFKYPIWGVSVLFNAGLSSGFMINGENQQKVESWVLSNETVLKSSALENTKSYNGGYAVGAGIAYKKISAELRYEDDSGVSDYPSLSSKVKRFIIMMSYRFY